MKMDLFFTKLVFVCLFLLIPPFYSWAYNSIPSLEHSRLIHAIKMANSAAVLKSPKEFINTIYKNKTPLMTALQALGNLMVNNEQQYKKKHETEYKNIIGPSIFTLATGIMLIYASKIQKKNDTIKDEEEEDEPKNKKDDSTTMLGILVNPIAVPGAMFFGGLVWLLPDLYYNLKILYYRMAAQKALDNNEIKTRYQIALNLINTPDIDLSVATKEGKNALDILHSWQEKITTSTYRTMLHNLEQIILAKMHTKS